MSQVTFRVADGSGDTATIYRTDDAAEVAKAMAKFDELVKGHKHSAYNPGKGGEGATLLRSAEEALKHEEVVFFPQRQGG